MNDNVSGVLFVFSLLLKVLIYALYYDSLRKKRDILDVLFRCYYLYILFFFFFFFFIIWFMLVPA